MPLAARSQYASTQAANRSSSVGAVGNMATKPLREPNKARCRLCGAEDHSEDEHKSQCAPCQEGMVTDGAHCTHGLHCIHCKQAHSGDYRKCPIRVAKYGSNRENEGKAHGKRCTARPPPTSNLVDPTPPAAPATPRPSAKRFRDMAAEKGLDVKHLSDQQITSMFSTTTASILSHSNE